MDRGYARGSESSIARGASRWPYRRESILGRGLVLGMVLAGRRSRGRRRRSTFDVVRWAASDDESPGANFEPVNLKCRPRLVGQELKEGDRMSLVAIPRHLDSQMMGCLRDVVQKDLRAERQRAGPEPTQLQRNHVRFAGHEPNAQVDGYDRTPPPLAKAETQPDAIILHCQSNVVNLVRNLDHADGRLAVRLLFLEIGIELPIGELNFGCLVIAQGIAQGRKVFQELPTEG